MSKRALVVGIDRYDEFDDLDGCANDATAVRVLLARNEDESPNLDSRLLSSATGPVTRDAMLAQLDRLLAPGADFALLYFAGHGLPARGDVVLVSSDGNSRTPGVRFTEILERAQASKVKEVAVILDCCFAGAAGTLPPLGADSSFLPLGLSMLMASRADQVSLETVTGRGIFSTYLEGGLSGGAADVLGRVTIAGLYSYLSESFGAWEQRPTFKASVDRLHEIRRCEPRVPLADLRRLPVWFPVTDHVLPLDPSYEQTEEPRHPEHEAVFAALQRLRDNRLVEPVGESHMYFAAMNSTGCRLTALGKHYRRVAAAGRI